MSKATTLVLRPLAQPEQTKWIRKSLASPVDLLRDTTKLVGITDTVLDSIKLKLPSNHLLNELAQHVE